MQYKVGMQNLGTIKMPNLAEFYIAYKMHICMAKLILPERYFPVQFQPL